MNKTPDTVSKSSADVGAVSKERPYTTPVLKTWGTVFDLTRTGLTHPGADAKAGSVLSKGL
ncbi:MAG TPA: hypothetical protein VKZ59_09490 [Acidobacteriota bacterium]|nr:hypothetical protein [Acidobacteriota bacterium]